MARISLFSVAAFNEREGVHMFNSPNRFGYNRPLSCRDVQSRVESGSKSVAIAKILKITVAKDVSIMEIISSAKSSSKSAQASTTENADVAASELAVTSKKPSINIINN